MKISEVFRHKILRGQFGPNFGPVAAGRKSAVLLARAAAVGLFSKFFNFETIFDLVWIQGGRRKGFSSLQVFSV